MFLSDERYGRCPDCGFTFELEPTQPARERASVGSVVYDILKTLLVLVLVMAGLTAVFFGIAFVGCALAFHGHGM